MLPGIFLVISIGCLARHRFFTPDDIDGSGLTKGTQHARILQSLLQNTLEQSCVALLAYLDWAVIMPAPSLSVVPLAAITFAIGRILFFYVYQYGAPSKAIGFTLTFYPLLIMLICILCSLAFNNMNAILNFY